MPAFLAAVEPQIAIISTGEQNPYGHPSQGLLQRLNNASLRALHTDRYGHHEGKFTFRELLRGMSIN